MPLSNPLCSSLYPSLYPSQLFDLLTARETLWFYGRIRGIDPVVLTGKVEDLIVQVGLSKFADRTSGTYSGEL